MKKVTVSNNNDLNGNKINGTFNIVGQFFNNVSKQMNYVLNDGDAHSPFYIVELSMRELDTIQHQH